MLYTTETLECMAESGGALGQVAGLALRQRAQITELTAKPNVLERQVRDLTAENKRLRRRIAELESITA